MLGALVRSVSRSVAAMPLLMRESTLDPPIRDAGRMAGGDQGIPYPFSAEEYSRLYETQHVIHRCATLIAQAVAEGRLLFKRSSSRAGGDEELPETHPLVQLFAYVNPRMTLRGLIQMTMLRLELTGNAYWEMVRSRDGAPVIELFDMRSARVKIVAGGKRLAGYTYEINGKRIPLEPWRVLHLLYADPNDDWYGIPAARAAARIIDADQAQRKTDKMLVENRSAPSAIVRLKAEMNAAQMDYISQQWALRHQGPQNAGKVAFLAGAEGVEFMQLSPAEMQALERLASNKHELMQLLGVYPVIYGEVDTSATRENATTQRFEFRDRTVAPKAGLLTDTLTELFIPTCGILGVENVYAVMDFSETTLERQIRADAALAQALLTDRGVVTINEIREDLGRDPVPWGDAWYGPFSTGIIADEGGAIDKRDPFAADAPAPEPRRLLTRGQRGAVEDIIKAIRLDVRDDVVRRVGAVLKHIGELHAKEALTEIGSTVMYDPARLDTWTDRKLKTLLDTAINGHAADLREAIEAAGDDPIAGLDDYMEGRLVSARMAARTETTGAANHGRVDAYTEAGIERHTWISSRDEAVRDSHAAIDGEAVAIGDRFSNGLEYPGDPSGDLSETANCVIGSTPISGRIVAGLKAFYAGEAVQIRMADGEWLTVTINHPVCGADSIVPAGELREGDYVVGYLGDSHGRAARWNDDVEYPPASAEDVYEALTARGAVRVHRPTPLDLDGDGLHLKGKINLVEVAAALSNSGAPVSYADVMSARDTAPAQFLEAGQFVETDIAVGMVGASFAAASAGCPSSPKLAPYGLRVISHGEPLRGLRFGPAAQLDTSLYEVLGQGSAAYVGFTRDVFRSFSGLVALRKIAEIRKIDFCGHVYDFQTEAGYFASGNVLSRNCRCDTLAVIPGARALDHDAHWREFAGRLDAQERTLRRALVAVFREQERRARKAL